jgi:hypothetical protein
MAPGPPPSGHRKAVQQIAVPGEIDGSEPPARRAQELAFGNHQVAARVGMDDATG